MGSTRYDKESQYYSFLELVGGNKTVNIDFSLVKGGTSTGERISAILIGFIAI